MSEVYHKQRNKPPDQVALSIFLKASELSNGLCGDYLNSENISSNTCESLIGTRVCRIYGKALQREAAESRIHEGGQSGLIVNSRPLRVTWRSCLKTNKHQKPNQNQKAPQFLHNPHELRLCSELVLWYRIRRLQPESSCFSDRAPFVPLINLCHPWSLINSQPTIRAGSPKECLLPSLAIHYVI